MAYKAIIAGVTGLIGSNLLNILLDEEVYHEIIILVRKESEIKNLKVKEVIIDYDKLVEFKEYIKGHTVFCCLGSTRKKTPDLAVYRKIDHDYPLQLAQLAKENGVEQYHLVSALGADKNSSNFYTKMKGEAEADIKQVGLRSLHIYQPSLLTGNRKEHRIGEKIATMIMRLIDPLLIDRLKKYRSIPAQTVAMAMFKQSLIQQEGVFIHPSDNIKQIA